MALGSGNIEINVGARGFEDDIVSQVNNAQRRIQPLNLKLDDKGFRQPLGRITGDLSEFQNSLDASVARTLAFGAAVGVINSVANAFKGLINNATEVEKKLKDVNVILNLNNQALSRFSDSLFQVAKQTGSSFDAVSDAAVELARQGLGAEETLKRINNAMILTRLSGMEATKSVETLTAAINGFGSAALDTTQIINKLATVDAAFAVSTDDLANALARAGSTAQAAKVSMDELLGAVTSVQQMTARGGAVIGNAFKSIFTRIQRSSVREQLEAIGVATMDASGNIRNAMSILQDYAQVYKTLSDGQRAYTDELLAGVFQINNLRALVKDLGSGFSIYERAMKQSANATDEATRRNAELDKTMAALMNKSIANVKQLAAALGSIVASPAVKNLLTIFNSISEALVKALDPEKGSKVIKGMFGAIGKFISGPGLLLIGAAFIKLFKFITGQSLKAVKEVFKIRSATSQVADTEAKITAILKQNQSLYQAISREALSHSQKEQLVLQVINAENAALARQQQMISQLARSRNVQQSVSGLGAAKGFVPNLANGVKGAIESEKQAIQNGVGGASKGAKPKVLKNFPVGKGKKETFVANTDEVVVPNYGGGSGSAIMNPDMIAQLGGMPADAKPVARGFIPSFAKLKAPSEERFYMPGGKMGAGATLDGRFYAMVQVGNAISNAAKSKDISMDPSGINRYAKLYSEELKRKKDPYSKDILNIPNLFLKNKAGEISPLKINEVTKELMKPMYRFQQLSGPSMGKPNKEAQFYASMFDGFIPNFILNWAGYPNKENFGTSIYSIVKGIKPQQYSGQKEFSQALSTKTGKTIASANVSATANPASTQSKQLQKQLAANFPKKSAKMYKDWQGWVSNDTRTSRFKSDVDAGLQGKRFDKALHAYFNTDSKGNPPMDWGNAAGVRLPAAPDLRKAIDMQSKYTKGDAHVSSGHGDRYFLDKIFRDNPKKFQELKANIKAGKDTDLTGLSNNYVDIVGGRSDASLKKQYTYERLFSFKDNKLSKEWKALSNSVKGGYGKQADGYSQGKILFNYRLDGVKDPATLNQAGGFIPNFISGTEWNKIAQEYMNSGNMRAVSQLALDTRGVGAIIGAGSGSSITRSGRAPSLPTQGFTNLFGNVPLSALGIVGPDGSPATGGNLPLGEYLMAGKGTNIQAKYPMASVYDAENKSAEVSKSIGPKLLQAVKPGLQSAAESIYKKVLPGQAAGVASQQIDPERYLSSSVQGGLLEGAIRFGSDALAGEFGAADAEGAAWDFTAGGNIPPATKNTFFSGTGVQVADAKRSKQAAGKGPSGLLEKTMRSIAGGAPQSIFSQIKGQMATDLQDAAKSIEGPRGPLSKFAANKASLSGPKAKTEEAKSAFGGFIPSFADMAGGLFSAAARMDKKKGGGRRNLDMSFFYPQAGKGSSALKNVFKDIVTAAKSGKPYTDIEAGAIVGPRIPKLLVEGHRLLQRKRAGGADIPKMKISGEIYPSMLIKKINKFADEKGEGVPQAPADYMSGEEKEVEKYLKALGMDPTSSRGVSLSSTPLLSKGFAGGFVPSYADSGTGSTKFDRDSYTTYGGKLNIRSFFPKSGSSSIGNLFKDVIAAAQAGTPYSSIEAGEIVGPRIPKMLITAKKILDKKRAAGLKQPRMPIDGFMEPHGLFTTLGRNKRWFEAEKKIAKEQGREFKPSQPGTGINKAPLKAKYVPKEEQALISSLQQLGLKVNEKDAYGGFKEFDRYFLKNMPLFSGGFAGGFIPNFVDALGLFDEEENPHLFEGKSQLEGVGKYSEVYDKEGYSGRTLDIGYLSSGDGSGRKMFKTLLDLVSNAAREGNPFTEIDAGSVVGPRIPSVLIKSKKLLDRMRAGGKDIPFMKVDGFMNPPAALFEKLGRKKDEQKQFGKGAIGRHEYKSGDEKELANSLRQLGLNPESEKMVMFSEVPMLQQFASGFIPNYLDVYRGVKVPKGAMPNADDVFKAGESSLGKFRPSEIYSIPQLQDYLQAHAQSALGTGLVSSSTSQKTAESFATTSDPTKRGVVGRKSMSHKRMYNPRKVEKLVKFLMDRRQMSERDAVQWFVKQAKNKPIGFDVKRWLNEMDAKQFGGEDEIAILNKSSFDQKDYARGFIPNFALGKMQKVDQLGSAPRPILEDIITELIFKKYEQPIRMGAKGRYKGQLNEDEIDEGWMLGILQAYQNRSGDPKERFFFTRGMEPPVASANLTSREIDFELKKRGIDPQTGKLKMTLQRAAGGFIPNFADALEGAIVREKEALAAQGSDAGIYVDQDKRVKGPENPMGLLVANTRDEPLAGSQGVDRAIKGGLNPKTMGKAEGFIPSFAQDVTSAAAEALMTAANSLEQAAAALGGAAGAQQQAAQTQQQQSQPDTLSQQIEKGEYGGAEDALRNLDQLDLSEVEELRTALINRFNKLGESATKEAHSTERDIDKLTKTVKEMDAVGHALGAAKVDINQEIKDFKIKNVDFGDAREQVMGGRGSHSSKALQMADVRGGEGLTKIFNKMMGPVDKVTGKLKGFTSKFSGIGKVFGKASSGLSFLSEKFFFLESGLTMLSGVLEPFGIQLPTISDGIGMVIDAFKGIDRAAVEAGEKRSEALDTELKQMAKMAEAADKFASNADALNQALDKGDIEVAGKQLQNLMNSMEDLGGIDNKAIIELIDSIGDTEAFAKAKADMDDAIQNNKALKEAEKDMEDLGVEIKKLGSDSEGVAKLMDESADTFSNVASKMVKNLSPEDLKTTADALDGVSITAGNVNEVLRSSGPLYDQMSDGMKKLMEESPATAAGILKLAQEQSKYRVEMDRLMAEWDRLNKATEPLTPVLSRLSTAMVNAANATKSATDTLFEAAKKAAEVEAARYQSQNVVTDQEAAVAQADFQKQAARQQGAINIEAELAKIGPALLKGAAEGGTFSDVRDGVQGNPELEALLGRVADGTATTGDSIMALDAAIQNSAGEDKESLLSIRDAVRTAAAEEHNQLAKIESELQAQLAMMDIQNANLLKTQVATVGQLSALNDLKDIRMPGEGADEVDRRIAAESLKKAADAMASMGFGNTEGQAQLQQAAMDESILANIASSFQWATGGDFALTGDNILAMNQQIQDFIQGDGLNNLNEAQKNAALGIAESVKNLSEQDLLDPTGRGSSKEMADKMTGALKIDQANLEQLSSAISKGMSEAMAELLGITAEQAAVFEGTGDQQASLAQEALAMNSKNVSIEERNAQALENIKESMKNVAAELANNSDGLDNSASALSRAATALSSAADKLAGTAAGGFIPNFAQTGSVERAASTEKAMGGKPVVDSHPSVGTYVRDGSRQPNFAAVRRDHPEGMNQAIKNSARKQGVMAGGFIPNFAMAGEAQGKALLAGRKDIAAALTQINPTNEKPEDQLSNKWYGDYLSNFYDPIYEFFTAKYIDTDGSSGKLGAIQNFAEADFFDRGREAVGVTNVHKFNAFNKKRIGMETINEFANAGSFKAGNIVEPLKSRGLLNQATAKMNVEDLIYGTDGPSAKFADFLNSKESKMTMAMAQMGLVDSNVQDYGEDIMDIGPLATIGLPVLDALGWISTALALAGTVATGGAAAPLLAVGQGIRGLGTKWAKSAIRKQIVTNMIKKKGKAELLAKKKLAKSTDWIGGGNKKFDLSASEKAIFRQANKKGMDDAQRDALLKQLYDNSTKASLQKAATITDKNPALKGALNVAKGAYNISRIPDRLSTAALKGTLGYGKNAADWAFRVLNTPKGKEFALKTATGATYGGVGATLLDLDESISSSIEVDQAAARQLAQEQGQDELSNSINTKLQGKEYWAGATQEDALLGIPKLDALIKRAKHREGKEVSFEQASQGLEGGLSQLPPGFQQNLNDLWYKDGNISMKAIAAASGADISQWPMGPNSSSDLALSMEGQSQSSLNNRTIQQIYEDMVSRGPSSIPVNMFPGALGKGAQQLLEIPNFEQTRNALGLTEVGGVLQEGLLRASTYPTLQHLLNNADDDFVKLGMTAPVVNSALATEWGKQVGMIQAGVGGVLFPGSLNTTAVNEETSYTELSNQPSVYNLSQLMTLREEFVAAKAQAQATFDQKKDTVEELARQGLQSNIDLAQSGVDRADQYANWLQNTFFNTSWLSTSEEGIVSNPKIIGATGPVELAAGNISSLQKLGAIDFASILQSVPAAFSQNLAGGQDAAANFLIKDLEAAGAVAGSKDSGPVADFLNNFYSPDLLQAITGTNPEKKEGAIDAAKANLKQMLDVGLGMPGALPDEFQQNAAVTEWDPDTQTGGKTYQHDGKCFWSQTGEPAPNSECARAGGAEGAAVNELVDEAIVNLESNEGAQQVIDNLKNTKAKVKEKEEDAITGAVLQQRNRRYSALLGKVEEEAREEEDLSYLGGVTTRIQAQALIDSFKSGGAREGELSTYYRYLQEYSSDSGGYAKRIENLDRLATNTGFRAPSEEEKQNYLKEKAFYEDALKLVREKFALYSTAKDGGLNLDILADYLSTKTTQSIKLPWYRGGEKEIAFPKVSDGRGGEIVRQLVNDYYLDIKGGPGKFENLPEDVKAELENRAIGEKGSFTPSAYLATDGYNDDPDAAWQQEWAKVAQHGANPDGNIFANELKALGPAQIAEKLKTLGIDVADNPEAREALAFAGDDVDQKIKEGQMENILNTKGVSEQFDFLMDSARQASAEDQAKLIEALGSKADAMEVAFGAQGGDPFADGGPKLGIDQLKDKQISIKPNADLPAQTTKAFNPGEVTNLKDAVLEILFANRNKGVEDEDRKIKGGGGTLTEALELAEKNANIDEIRMHPSYMLREGGSIEQGVKRLLGADDADTVPNIDKWESWTKWLRKMRLTGDNAKANLPQPPPKLDYLDPIGWKTAGAFARPPNGFDDIPPPPGGNADWKSFLEGTFGDKIMSGENTAINALLEGSQKHYYGTVLSSLGDVDTGPIKEYIKGLEPNMGSALRKYAWTGKYPLEKGKRQPLPPGSKDVKAMELAFAQAPRFGKTPDNEMDVEEVVGESGKEEPLFGPVESAKGFVPNFSKIAGEISAANEAGYSKPVTPSQVKTMNIPGRGKTAYNTQETIMRGAGMTQPFIVPPSNSKAAQGYGQKVQKKFGFNPYSNAADGFIPNFESSAEVTAFMNSLSNFAEKIDVASKVFGEAAQVFKDKNQPEPAGAQPTAEVSAEPLAAAVTPIAASIGELNGRLDGGVQLLGADTLGTEMSTLNSTLQGLSIDMNLKVDDVNVNVNGGGAIQSEVQSAFDTNIKGIIATEIEGMKKEIIDAAVREMGGNP